MAINDKLRRHLVKLSETLTWSTLARLGSTPPMRLTILIPFLGSLLLLNENTASWLQLSKSIAPYLDEAERIKFNMHSLYFTYFGLCALGLGSIVFALFCPTDVQQTKSVEQLMSEAERTEIISEHKYTEMLELYFTAKGYAGLFTHEDFREERLTMPYSISSRFRSLISRMSTEVGAIWDDSELHLASKEEFFSPPYGELNPDAVATLLWHRAHFNRPIWIEYESLSSKYFKDISFIRFKMLDVSRFYSRILVSALFASGFALLGIQTSITFFRLGMNIFR